MIARLVLLIAGVSCLLAAAGVAVLTYVWPHFPPMDWEAIAPNLIEGAGGLGATLLAIWGLAGGGSHRRGPGEGTDDAASLAAGFDSASGR